MGGFWFLYDPTSGIIQNAPQQSATNPWPNPPASWSVLGPLTSNDAGLAYLNPQRYLIEGTPAALVAQPYLTLTAAVAADALTLTATLNAESGTAPADVVFTVAGTDYTVLLTADVATFSATIHPSVAAFAITASVSATGVVGAQTTFGGSAACPVGVQCYQALGGARIVAPTGPGSLAFLRGYYSTLVDQANMAGDLATADSLALHTLLAVVVPALVTAGTVTLDASQTAALDYLTTNLLPYLPATLENAAPGGVPIQPVALFVADEEVAAQAFASYAADVGAGGIPNLA